jgi:hypothetical protein
MQYPRLVITWRILSLQATTAVEDWPGAYRGALAHGARLSLSLAT